MTSSNVNQIIIKFVQENPFIYDRNHVNFKNVSLKRQLWRQISEYLDSSYGIEMTVDNIDRRWTSIRDMFSREHRNRKQRLSGLSGIKKEWPLYNSMTFLLPHVTPRSCKLFKYVGKTQGCSSTFLNTPDVSEDSKTEFPIYKNNTHESDILEGSLSNESTDIQDYSYLGKESSNKRIKIEIENSIEGFVENVVQDSCESESLKEVTVPEDESIEVDKFRDPYLVAIEEGFKYVPLECRTQCLIEILQTIRKYEKR